MTEPLDRNDVIELLNRLGSDQDDEVLDAARQVHARVASAGVSWEELLVPEETQDDAQDDAEDEADEAAGSADSNDGEGDEDTDDGEGDEETDDHGREDETPASAAEKEQRNAETLALIAKLLARPENSSDFRTELEDYKRDIAEDEFEPDDHRYIQALYKRLIKTR